MKKLILLFPFLLITVISAAQFGPQIDISRSTAGPTDAKAFDLDGDGDLDVLSASSSDDKIAWYENLGGGIFGPQRIITNEANNAYSVHSADIDGDGDMDVLSASYFDDKIVWYENEGNGIFGPQQIISTDADGAQAVYVADLDGDGDMDVLSASRDDDKIAWYENEGGGSFDSQQIITTEADNARSVYSTDLDGDGDMDILSASFSDDKIAWYENDGFGNFGSQQIITTQADGALLVNAADLDGDGDMDVISASSSDDKIAWYENEEGGVFGAQQIITNQADGARYVYTADLDGDGDLDVLSASRLDAKIAWYENVEGGLFGPQQIISTDATSPNSIYAADLDDDGDIDVLSASIEDDKIVWYQNSGDGNFSSQLLISTTTGWVSSVYAVDLDNDGDLDVLWASLENNKIAWFENEGNDTFSEQQVISYNAEGANSVNASDLDGDGDIDVLSASRHDNKIAWYENEGQGTFSSQQIITTQADGAFSVYAVDLDGDEDMDVLSASNEDDKIAWYENDGVGNFGPQQIITTNADGATSVYAADLDSDGDMDVLSGSTMDSKIAWYENDSYGVFGPQQIITTEASDARSVYVADLDGDEDMDVLSASTLDGKIAWYENQGEGNFGSQQIIFININEAYSVYAADLDADGDLDVLSALGYFAGGVSWFENENDANFGQEQIIITDTFGAQTVYAADLDGDGDMDVLSASALDSKIAWYENYLYNTIQIRGKLFFDVNQNGLHDSLDTGFNQLGVTSIPQSDYTYTYSNGNYFMNFSNAISSYQVFPESLPNWSITTDSLSYTVLIDSNFTSLDSLDFGFYPNTFETHIQSDLTGGFPRCNDTINYWINVHNLGTSLPGGIIHLQLADSITYISSEIEPDSITGQNIYWHYDSLFYFSSTSINLEVEMPPFTSMGDTLTSVLTVHELDEENNIIYSISDTLNQVSVCAYDPNDKSVNPAGVGEEGYISQNQELEYLIRFQNTGNDTAITVVIKDQLHANLDWSSLQPIASSHPMQIHVEQTGEAVFTFENIMLPDSNVNVLGSQGFVKFSVMPDEGLLPNTLIHNTANIYFDQNPAVVTNTVLNTIECYNTPQPVVAYISPYLSAGVTGDYIYQWFYNGEEIPEAISDTLTPIENGFYTVAVADTNNCVRVSEGYLYNSVGLEESEKIKAVVYPNPFSESTSIVFAQNLNGDYDLLVNNFLGKLVKRINKIEGNTITLHKSDLGKGAFLCYVVNNRTGERVFIEKLVIQ